VHYLLTLSAALLALLSLHGIAIAQGRQEIDSWKAEVVAADLIYPWDINRSGELLFITEVAGNVVVVSNGKSRRHRIQTSDPVVHDGGSGLLGMALAADFAKSGLAYAYYSYRTGSGLANKVVQVLYDDESWRETRVLIQGIPGHQLYNGGRIAIGPDGHLYVTTGWAGEAAHAQDLKSLAGKILRVGLDGRVPSDNPFPNSLVYSYGHRNPQGLAWSADGRLFISEHGPSGNDELNVIVPKGNYGWPDNVGDRHKVGLNKPLLHSRNT
jgi:glucose/arabinose dehydrogenase